MAKLTEEMVHARTRQSNLTAVSKLNCWGSELQDVSLVRRLPNVEVLSLSVNKIRNLSDFQHCKKLKHLFVRKNDIRELNQVCYLRELPDLSTLWLAENPCASSPGYRLAVIKALPRLEKLDDVVVSVEERTEAQRYGTSLLHPDNDEPQDTDEQYITRSNHYPPTENTRPYQRNDYSPELSSPVHSSYMRNAGNTYSQEESVQSNGYEPSGYDHIEDDYRPHSSAIHISTPNHHRISKDLAEDESPPRSVKQDDDGEELHPRGLTRSRTESLPRLSRLEVDDPEEYSRNMHSRCRLDTIARGARQEVEDPEPRMVLTRSRTVDMLGGHHAGSLSSLHERERPRMKPCEVFMPRSLQQPHTRPRNINVLNAVLCLIKELELQDLELVAMSVNCRIDELRV
ncbi:uncharacterized protein LOC128998264 isoform X2 [Macrosteles quadrilineatus]|uniref:uncharacterized protein LOC128998264 isoform X2 n=1 Tax=Macrosteles quadrilineatus TaxID=74068 RepID=UPI0023E2AB00|nr:uncharacterized protein LOC128998264 isoform X2 [Macrosteles quadrilineatus]